MRVIRCCLLTIGVLSAANLVAQTSECGTFTANVKGAVNRTIEGRFANCDTLDASSEMLSLDFRTGSPSSDSVFILSFSRDENTIPERGSYRISSDLISASEFSGMYLEKSKDIPGSTHIQSWRSGAGTLKILSHADTILQGEFQMEAMGWVSTAGQKIEVEGKFNAVRESDHCQQLARAAKVLPPPKEPKQFLFAEAKWGEDRATVADKLSAIDFTLADGPEDGVQTYNGSLLNNPAMARLEFVDGGLALVTVGIESKEGRSRTLYNELKDALVKKYGFPSADMEHYDWPFTDHDEYGDLAISTGKATIGAAWEEAGSELRIVLTEKHWVGLRYASPQGVAAEEKRRAKSLQPF